MRDNKSSIIAAVDISSIPYAVGCMLLVLLGISRYKVFSLKRFFRFAWVEIFGNTIPTYFKNESEYCGDALSVMLEEGLIEKIYLKKNYCGNSYYFSITPSGRRMMREHRLFVKDAKRKIDKRRREAESVMLALSR